MAKGVCGACDGTGVCILANGWNVSDGYRQHECSLCKGTGKSSFRLSPDAKRYRQQVLARVKAWGGLMPPTKPPQSTA